MQRFDCLSVDCPLFGPHLLEASAGTGKTFSIEHVFVRLLLEKVELEQILAVTFTRAATRELKKRIADHIQKALHSLEEGTATWPYLGKYLHSKEALSRLRFALETFDHCQIFTIHGFCYRMLSEFAFEAHLGFSLSNPDEDRLIPQALKEALNRFLEEGLTEDLLCTEQIAKLMKKEKSMKELSDRLLKLEPVEIVPQSFSALSRRWEILWSQKSIEEEKLASDFAQLSLNYKKIKGNFPRQIKALANKDFRTMIREEGTLFSFIDPKNQKVKIKPIEKVHDPHFFDWGREHLLPLIQVASDQKKIFQVLAAKWNEIALEICREENHFQPDELLRQMRRSIENRALADLFSKKYSAVIIDEFQDTDPIQWDIFSQLFINKTPPLAALYLVGDPKQSIYRFRKADVYTYFSARELLGEKHLYHLDTNFRSNKALIDAMNALFDRNWLSLPQLQKHISYHPVQAGLPEAPSLSDGKGAIHWVNVKPLYIWEYAAQEIEKLYDTFSRFSAFAILVKDRYQAQEALALLQKRKIPAKARSHTPLGKTDAFQAIEELLDAILFPQNQTKKRAASFGPFSLLGEELPFARWKNLIEEKGLIPFAKEVLSDHLPFYIDARQIFEELFAWEQKEGYSSVGLKNFLETFKKLDAEEGGRRRIEENEDAVQILTVHISKGLEFEVVFAWGLAFSAKESDIEIDAEKLRQLYVAMTRAKCRLYLPFTSEGNSPMALFCRQIESEEGALASYFQKINVTYEEINELSLPAPRALQTQKAQSSSLLPLVQTTPSYLQSFTSLSCPTPHLIETLPKDVLPLGSETGILFHEIFEELFSSSQPIWKNSDAVLQLIQKKLRYSPLSEWEKTIHEFVLQTLSLPLPGSFSLKDLLPEEVFPEMEFLFYRSPHFVKGFIDLVFCKNGIYYLADWKTNWLGTQTMEEIMESHDYWLQASLYTEAIQRYLGDKPFGGAFYFFLRSASYLQVPHGI